MKKTVTIVGGGPSALILAAFLDPQFFDVTIYEKNKSLGRKFLVAGKGGFNLTHSESIEQFVKRYTPSDFIENALLAFNNEDLRQWLNEIGIPTFIGSSKRVYPEKGIKPIQVLKAILAVLEAKNVSIKYEHVWNGWKTENTLLFNSNVSIQSNICVFALGGASWRVTGSDGSWPDLFSEKGIETKSFQAANCAYKIDWPAGFLSQNEGKPLKNISISCDGITQKGEAVITQFGLEGNAIYALSPPIQHQLNNQSEAIIYLDLKPSLTQGVIEQRISSSKKKTTDTLRKDLKLSSTQLSLLKAHLTKEEFLNPSLLSEKIKKLPLKVLAAAPIDQAISTTGGITLEQVSEYYEFKKLKNHYCIGEMLDWNAPTGGYLLQGCFSMGVFLAHYLNTQS